MADPVEPAAALVDDPPRVVDGERYAAWHRARAVEFCRDAQLVATVRVEDQEHRSTRTVVDGISYNSSTTLSTVEVEQVMHEVLAGPPVSDGDRLVIEYFYGTSGMSLKPGRSYLVFLAQGGGGRWTNSAPDSYFIVHADYIRSHYGFDNDSAEYLYSTAFGPSSWHVGVQNVPQSAISPVDMASSDDSHRGVIFLTSVSGAISVPRAWICDPTCEVEIPGVSYASYTAPALTTSVGHNPNRWLAAYLYGDSLTSTTKNILIAEKDHGAASWATPVSLNVDTSRTVVSADYDWDTDTFVVGYLNNDDEIEFRVRSRAGGPWAGTDTNIRAFEGVSVACDAIDDQPDGNCVAVWADIEAWTALMWARFRVDPGSHNVTFGTIRSAGWTTIARPTIVNRWDAGTNPEFLMAFSQGSQLIYTRTLTLAYSRRA